MELDFTGLDGLAQRDQLQGATAPAPELNQIQGMGRLQIEADRQREAAERSLEICQEYQDNVKAIGSAQTFILKGIQAGENPYKLLLTACECIGRLTSNKTFKEQVRAEIEAVAGKGLLQPDALEIEMEGIKSRLAMMVRPELEHEPEDSRRRIVAAIKAHQQRAREIEKIIYRKEGTHEQRQKESPKPDRRSAV